MTRLWRLASCLVQLRNQINQLAPSRNTASDGSIGNAEHASRESDHNPWIDDPTNPSRGVVSAIDITHDPTHNVDGHVLSRELIKDPRAKYVIHAGEIWKARTGRWEAYHGPNRHDHHVHISVLPHEIDHAGDWPVTLENPAVAPASHPVLQRGDRDPSVKLLQELLGGLSVDSTFGPKTEQAVKDFQQKHGLPVTGIVDQATWNTLVK